MGRAWDEEDPAATGGTADDSVTGPDGDDLEDTDGLDPDDTADLDGLDLDDLSALDALDDDLGVPDAGVDDPDAEEPDDEEDDEGDDTDRDEDDEGDDLDAGAGSGSRRRDEVVTGLDGVEERDPVTEDGDDEPVLREGEFVCRSCHMAKRETALADPDALLCRDCV